MRRDTVLEWAAGIFVGATMAGYFFPEPYGLILIAIGLLAGAWGGVLLIAGWLRRR